MSSRHCRFRIAKEKYYPAPGVDGALVTFSLTPPASRAASLLPPARDRDFLSVVDSGFGERRKMLRNSLQPRFSGQQVIVCGVCE